MYIDNLIAIQDLFFSMWLIYDNIFPQGERDQNITVINTMTVLFKVFKINEFLQLAWCGRGNTSLLGILKQHH